MYWLLGAFLLWITIGVLLKTKAPVKTIYNKFNPPPPPKKIDRFDLEF